MVDNRATVINKVYNKAVGLKYFTIEFVLAGIKMANYMVQVYQYSMIVRNIYLNLTMVNKYRDWELKEVHGGIQAKITLCQILLLSIKFEAKNIYLHSFQT